MKARFVDSIASVPAADWDAVAGHDYPFLRHAFLHALEASGSASAARGWQPQHLLVEDNGRLVAVLPLYLKQHSMGEYVFDHSWARAYQRHQLDYYPKLVSAIPFTPASGPRLAHLDCDTGELMQNINAALQQGCEQLGASGWHVLFPAGDELPLWEQSGSLQRLGCQFHWFNEGFGHFDDFLATFTSRKRKELKRERRKVAEQGVTLQRLTGDAITLEHWQAFYRFYQLTNLKYNAHAGYLTPDFFVRLHATLRDALLLVLACDEDGEAIAGALAVIGGDTLYGRYWGAIRDVECLHFEACYYQGIEFCIEHGLQRFDPGAQGEHKIPRGFHPVLTHSQHWVAHPAFREAIGEFVREEAEAVRQYQQDACSALPFRETL